MDSPDQQILEFVHINFTFKITIEEIIIEIQLMKGRDHRQKQSKTEKEEQNSSDIM